MNFTRRFAFLLLTFCIVMILGSAACDSDDATSPPAPTPTPTPSPSTTYPATCKEVQTQAIADTGSRPADGTYTLYINADKNSPWDAFCRRMNLDNPLEYLTVGESSNFSQIGNGLVTAVTSYRRYRIDPSTLEINPLDNTFSTNTGFDAFPTLVLPTGLDFIPAGWAEFQPTRSDDGPAAEAHVDLTGTPFVFADSILTNNLSDFFCAVSSPGTPVNDIVGTGATVAADLSSFILTAINSDSSNASSGVWTREVADCANLGGTTFTSASWPLQYVLQ